MKLQGYIDGADRTRIFGWARDEDAPGDPVSLIVTCDGELVTRVLANAFRPDLQAAFGGTGRFSFDVDVSGELSPLTRNVIEVIGEVDGRHLVGSPCVLEASGRFDDAVKAAIVKVLDAVHSDADLEERLTFLAERTEALLAAGDRLRSRRNERSARHRVKWRTNDAAAPMPPVATKLTALLVDARVPVIERDAGSIAIVSHMLSLQRLGYAVTFLAADLGAACGDLEARDIACLTRPWYACVEEALARNAGAYDLVYLHRADVAGPYLPLVRRYQPRARVVFAVADLASVRTWRQAEVEERPELRAHGQYLAAQEIAAGHQADAVITHSSAEASILRRSIDAWKIHVVPFAVAGRATLVPLDARAGLAFIGSFDHPPNADAALWLVETVMPKVAASHPSITCRLVGSAMPDHIARLASPTIVPMGAVDDLASVFDRVRLTIAPLAFGAGVKGKVLSSLAAGVPCVCTPVAAEGLDLPPSLKDLVASQPEDLATLIIQLHEDEDFNARCSRAGLDYIAVQASEQAVDAALRRVVQPSHATGTRLVGGLAATADVASP